MTYYRTLELPFSKDDNPDADERMFVACFEILGQFVEDELKKADIDAKFTHKGYNITRGGDDTRDHKAIDLWLWYRDELPVKIDLINCAMDSDAIEGVKRGKLLELVLLRNEDCLWT